MEHPINSKTRLTSPLGRIFHRVFGRSNPVGWADYHVVEERRGILWLHSHGLARRKGFEVEMVGVPADLRDEAARLLLAVVGMQRGGGKFLPDGDFAGRFTSPGQSFLQIGTFRQSVRTDKDHGELLRIVDFGEASYPGAPVKLLAAHLTARGQAQTDPKRAEKLFRRSLELFPGENSQARDAEEYDPAAGDITAFQARSNLGARLGLSLALRAQNRIAEARTNAVETIARCYEWARLYRDQFVQTDPTDDAYRRFWRDADLLGIATTWQPPAAQNAPKAQFGGQRQAGGFGGRATPVRRV